MPILYDEGSWGIVENLLSKYKIKSDKRAKLTSNNKIIACKNEELLPACTGETVFNLFLAMSERIDDLESSLAKLTTASSEPIDVKKIDERFAKIEGEIPIGFKELFFSLDKKLSELWSTRK